MANTEKINTQKPHEQQSECRIAKEPIFKTEEERIAFLKDFEEEVIPDLQEHWWKMAQSAASFGDDGE